MTKYCRKCGEKLKENDQFCPQCGEIIKDVKKTHTTNTKKDNKNNIKKDNKFKITEKNLIILSATIIIIISLIAVSAFYIFNQPEPTGTYNYNFDGYNFNIPNGYQKSDYTSSFGYGDDAFFDGSDGSIYISVSENSLTSAEDFTNNAKNSYNLNFTQGNINNINGYLSKTGLTGETNTDLFVFQSGDDLITVEVPDSIPISEIITNIQQN